MRTDNETSVAVTMQPMLAKLLGEPLPVDFEFWDGSTLHGNGHDGGDAAHHSVRVASPDACCATSCGRPVNSASRGPTCAATSTPALNLAETMRTFQASMPDDIVVAASALPAVVAPRRVRWGALTPRPSAPPEEVAPRRVASGTRSAAIARRSAITTTSATTSTASCWDRR